MSLTLGEKLRQAREARGISISEVAEQTRISALYLECIENNDYRQLPGGIFNKGFVKSFAKFVGVDEQEALQDYARLMSEQGAAPTEDEPKTYRPEVLTDDYARASRLPTLIMAAIILALFAGAIYYGVNYYQESLNSTVADNSNTNRAANSNANANANANAVPVAATPLPAANEIKFELKALADPISVTYTADGRTVSKNITPTEPLSVNPQQSLRVSYYKGFTADKVEMTLNGKQVAPPAPPARGNSLTFEITKDNVAQILQSGAIPAPGAAPNANAPAPR
jgi:cytoskeleton protein RodZ